MSLDKAARRHEGAVALCQVNRSGHFRVNDGPDRFGCTTPRFVWDNDPAFPHTWPTRTRTPRKIARQWDCRVDRSNVALLAASSSATQSDDVIRPDRDMRQFDGSIV